MLATLLILLGPGLCLGFLWAALTIAVLWIARLCCAAILIGTNQRARFTDGLHSVGRPWTYNVYF